MRGRAHTFDWQCVSPRLCFDIGNFRSFHGLYKVCANSSKWTESTRLIHGLLHLQDAAHPLEAVFLGGVGPLLRHHHDPLVAQHRHRKHSDPEQSSVQEKKRRLRPSPGRVWDGGASVNSCCLAFTSPCTQTSWVPPPAPWQPRRRRCVSARWPPSARPSCPRQTPGCPDGTHTAQNTQRWHAFSQKRGLWRFVKK